MSLLLQPQNVPAQIWAMLLLLLEPSRALFLLVLLFLAGGCYRLFLADCSWDCSWLLWAAPGVLLGCSWLLVAGPGCSWLLLAATLGCTPFALKAQKEGGARCRGVACYGVR